jgi:drug/metabolite transporter (DMT)-like permease
MTHAGNDPQTWSMFLLLSAIWGSSFLWIAIVLGEGVPPLTLVSLRTLFAAGMLALVLRARGGRLPLRWNLWKRLAALGASNIVIPFALIAWGQQYIPTGVASILNAMVPLFTIIFATVALTDEHVTPAKLGGLGVGFAGVVVLAWPSVQMVGVDDDAALAVAGMLAVAGAAVFYGIASVYTRRRVTGMHIVEQPDGSLRAPLPVEISLGSTVTAFVMISLLALAFERPGSGLLSLPQSALGWVGLVWLGALGTGVAYLLFFRIIERWGATRTTLVTYVIPLVAIALGFIVLGERLRPLELVGAVLIIAGVVLVNANVGQRPLWRRDRTVATVEIDSD